MYEIIVERSAEKDLKRIAVEVRPKLAATIRPLAEDPRPPGCRKLVGSDNDWRIRVGNYRIIYEIADEIPPYPGSKRVISYTNVDKTPSAIAEIYDDMVALKPDVIKLTVRARTPEDAWPLVQILSKPKNAMQ